MNIPDDLTDLERHLERSHDELRRRDRIGELRWKAVLRALRDLEAQVREAEKRLLDLEQRLLHQQESA